MPKLADGMLVSISSGRQELPILTVPDANDSVTIRLKRATSLEPLNWSNRSTTISLTVDASYDGGATWEFFVGATAEGGVHVTRTGVELEETTLSGTLRRGSGRRLRATLEVANGPLATRTTIEAT